MRKSYLFLLHLSVLFLLFGWQKIFTSDKNPAVPAVSKTEDAFVRTTYFGALIADKRDTASTDFKISVLKKMNATYTRSTIIIANWTGRNYDYEKYINNGIQPVLNINNVVSTHDIPTPFVTDTVIYKTKLDEILTKYSPEVVVIENEEADFEKHTGPMIDYINQLKAAMSIVHKHNLKGTDGGMSTKPLKFLVYRYYFNNGEYDKAASFGDRCIDDKYIHQLSHPGSKPDFEESMLQWDSLMQAFRTVPIDYVNIHFYEPIKFRNVKGATELAKDINTITPGALQEICDYIYNVTGKKTISNEMGQMNTLSNLTTGMMNECINVHMDYCIWFSGDWQPDGSFALQNSDGTLNASGRAFRDFIISHPH